jgi:hypothetical protein
MSELIQEISQSSKRSYSRPYNYFKIVLSRISTFLKAWIVKILSCSHTNLSFIRNFIKIYLLPSTYHQFIGALPFAPPKGKPS